MRTKPRRWFEILFELPGFSDNLLTEAWGLKEQEIIEDNHNTFAGEFLDYAQELLRDKKDISLASDLSIPEVKAMIKTIRESINDEESRRTVTQALHLFVIMLRLGNIPKLMSAGAVHIRRNVRSGAVGGEKSGKVRNDKMKPSKESWQAEADKIWKKHPTWMNKPVAEMVVKRIGGNVGTIRKSIKKPLF